ncbi:MAG: glycosyltransferase family 4 protein [Oscillospiraceae bacterium]|nr:glycosyltransferase family 4 protein [Oscillospiraceae bacterium]
MRVLNVYKWATVGGVERVILNRASAFKEHGLQVSQDVFFFHDSGGLLNFQKFIEKNKLEAFVHIVSEVNEALYDLIITFDTPEIFDLVSDYSKVLVECHSPYKESRVYLKSLPQNIACIASPGETFLRTVVEKDLPAGFKDKLFVLPNFHICDTRHCDLDVGISSNKSSQSAIWSKTPICYIGRMDSMKNTKELLEIFSEIKNKSDDEYFLMLVGDVRPHYMDLKETVRKANIEDRVAYYRPIPYEKVDALLRKIRDHRGLFISPSLGESFGLSALEAMYNGVPVLLSDLDCHKTLIASNEALFYKQGNLREAIAKVCNISDNYDGLSELVQDLALRHNSDAFIDAWKILLLRVGLHKGTSITN